MDTNDICYRYKELWAILKKDQMDKELEIYIENLETWLSERKKDLNYSLEQFDKLIIEVLN